MTSAEQRQWDAEQYERLAVCPDCDLPMVDRADRRDWPAVCECPFCERCGAHGANVETVMVEDDEVCDEVCRACREAEAR
jgi:hypothetical protein